MTENQEHYEVPGQPVDRLQQIKDRLAETEAISLEDALYLLMLIDQQRDELEYLRSRAREAVAK